ncbi:MAG: NF038143 family protein, partial [bacterium]
QEITRSVGRLLANLDSSDMRLKGAREVFSRNFLFTKELALKAALDMVKGGEPREEVMSRIEETTSGILASDKKGVYSEEIRQKQMKEIDLLIDHYCRLLEGEGKDYASLVINAYRTQKDYTTFLAQLEGAEREVNLAARQTLGTETAAEMVFKMEEATDRIRTAGVEKIFRTM